MRQGTTIIGKICKISLVGLIVLLSFAGCYREPYLHLPGEYRDIEIPMVDLKLETYWKYELSYDWKAEWVWDFYGELGMGEIGYTKPTLFYRRRYYTYNQPYGPHTNVYREKPTKDTVMQYSFEFGYWDMLVWSEIEPDPDDEEPQSLNLNETLEEITAYTNQSTRSTRYNTQSRYTRAFWQPEQLFSAYEQAIDINESLDGFDYDAERNVWVKKLNMKLEPITYIYLTQVVIYNNNNKIIGVDGSADLSGVARSTNVNTGISEDDPVTVTYNVFFKPSTVKKKRALNTRGDDEPIRKDTVDTVAVASGRLLTFGICGENGNRIDTVTQVKDKYRHYLDVNMLFNNGVDSTFVFDVTDQIRKRWKGGVITVEISMDTIPVPRRSGGSAFNAVVADYDSLTYEFPM